MGNRNRGGQQQGGSKKECTAIGRSRRGGRARYSEFKWAANKRRNLLSELRKTEKKHRKLLARGEAGKPGGIIAGSEREARLLNQIQRLKVNINLKTAAYKV